MLFLSVLIVLGFWKLLKYFVLIFIGWLWLFCLVKVGDRVSRL